MMQIFRTYIFIMGQPQPLIGLLTAKLFTTTILQTDIQWNISTSLMSCVRFTGLSHRRNGVLGTNAPLLLDFTRVGRLTSS